MKRIKHKISRGLKTAMVIASFLTFGAIYTQAQPKVKVTATYAFVGMVATLKGKKVEGEKTAWELLDAGTQKYFEISDSILKEAFDGKLDQKALDERIAAFEKEHGKGLNAEQMKEFNEMVASVKKHAEFIQKQMDGGLSGLPEGNAFAKAWEENADQIKAFKEKKVKSLSLEVKATQASTDTATHTIGERVPGIGQLPTRKPFMEDIFPSVTCNLEFIKYIDQETVVRDAKNVASAATSTHDTKLTWKERNIQIVGVRDFIHVPIDMMEDYDYVEGEIRNLLGTSMQLKVDNGLLKDDGTAPNLHSVNEYASEFDAANTVGVWSNKIEKANIFDLIVAMASQIVALGQDGSYMPDTVLMNTVDRYRSMLVKDENGQYLLPPFVAKVGETEYKIDGLRVRSNPNVAANTIYVFDSTKGTIYNRRGMTIEMSYENRDNFEHEMVTIKAYRRLNLLVRKVNQNAFMKCSDVEAGLEAITAA